MRAARNEIFGPDEVPRSGPEEFRDNKDLTSSRLQSELYRKLSSFQVGVWCRLALAHTCSVRSIPGSTTMFLPVQPYPVHCAGSTPDQRLPLRFRASVR